MKLLKHLHKRGLALFMALVLCLSLVQVTAFAEGEPIDDISGGDGIQTEDNIHEHVWNDGEVTQEPTCTAEGVKTFTCTVEGCGATKDEAIPVVAHTPVTDARVEPTETETGLTEGSHCSVCGAVLVEQEVIPATGEVLPVEVQAFLNAVDALYGIDDADALLAAVANAEAMYNALTNEQKALEAVAQRKYGLDTFRETMTLEESAPVMNEEELRAAVVNGGTVTLGGSIDLQATLEINNTVTLDLNGQTLSLASGQTGSVIKVIGDGAVFTLTDSSTGGTGRITGGKAENGGGVYVESGTFTLSGGTISNNTATKSGGGVYMDKDTSFTMSGGTITGNTASGNGGSRESGSGGGVYVNSNSTFTMSGGSITQNRANNKFQWVSEKYQKLGGGGGVYVNKDGTFNMLNGTISENTAAQFGGGVYVEFATFNLSNGMITKNTAGSSSSGEGGGLYYRDHSTVTMTGGTISENVAEHGAGVRGWWDWYWYEEGADANYPASKFTMSGGEIIDNTGKHLGGGVTVSTGEFIMEGGTISGNSTSTETNVLNDYGYGGGVCVYETCKMIFSGGKITGNRAQFGGGVYVSCNNDFTMRGTRGELHSNTASVAGDDLAKHYDGGECLEQSTMSLESLGNCGWKLADGTPITGWYIDGMDTHKNIYYDQFVEHGGTRPWDGDLDQVGMSCWLTDNAHKVDRWSVNDFYKEYTPKADEILMMGLKATHGKLVTLSYNANGGTGAPDPTYGEVSGNTANVPVSGAVPTRDGYTFLGWSTTPDGGVNYIGGNSITITADTTLYAVWEYNYVPYVPEFPTPTPTPTPMPVTPTPGGTTITDEETPLAGSVGLNDTDHFAYVIGYDDDTVRPLNNITRAEAATIFFRLMTEEYRQANWSTINSFTDVNTGDWYNNAVSTCANAGVLKGYNDGTFRPNAPITRAEFASMAAGFMDESITDDGTGDFSDTANHWAAAAIRRAAKAGWVTGTGNKFNPDEKITRAEVMTIVNRMLDRTPDKDHMLPTMKTWTDNPESEWYYEAVQEATNEHDYERDELNVETWTELLTVRDWKALETEWANNGGASAPKDETK